MDVPGKLKYTASHEWIADHGDGTVSVGITAVALDQLGELVYVELPSPGAHRSSDAAQLTVPGAATILTAPASPGRERPVRPAPKE